MTTRRFLAFAAVFAAGLATHWLLSRPSARPSPDQVGVRTISLNFPDASGPGGRRHETLRVRGVSAEGREVLSPGPTSWIIFTSQLDAPGGAGQVTYFADPVGP
jgi:hypothetical protein